MEIQTFPESVQRLFEQARTNFDQALLYQEQGNPQAAKQRAEAAMKLLAQVAEASSGYAKDQEMLLQMLAQGHKGFLRTEIENRDRGHTTARHILGIRYAHETWQHKDVTTTTTRMEVI